MQTTERKEVPKALDSNLIEIGVSVMDVNCTKVAIGITYHFSNYEVSSRDRKCKKELT